MAVHSTRLEISFEISQLENKVDILLEQKAPRKVHYTKLDIGFKLVVETKADILISQYSRFISYPVDNYGLIDLNQYAPASNFIDIECNQIDIADNLVDIELEQEAITDNFVEAQLYQPGTAENLIDIVLECYIPGETNEVEIELAQKVEFDNLIDIDVDHWVQFDNLFDALIAQYTTNNENLVDIELVKRSGISNFAEIGLVQFDRESANLIDLWIAQYVTEETLADVALNQAAYAESFVDITSIAWVIADNLVELLLDKTVRASNRVEIWLIAGANWNFVSVETAQIIRVINLADLTLMHRFFFETYDPGEGPWGEDEWDDEFSWQRLFDDDDDWGWF